MILYEDESWLAVEKPTGLSTHNARPADLGVVEWLALHLDRHLFICSRLDKDTSGVLLFAKTRKASGQAQIIHEQHQAQKTYLFVSDRSQPEGHTHWNNDQPLAQKNCSTAFRLLKQGVGYFLYEAVIQQGRTHQIRQHAALSGVPILGDTTYGGTAFARLCLHCCSVEWPPIADSITSEMPDSFALLLGGPDKQVLKCAIAWERRLRWPARVSNSYRIIHRGEIDLPVSIDLYNDFLSITHYSETVSTEMLKNELTPLLAYLAERVPTQGVCLRSHVRNPHHKKLVHDFQTWGKTIPESVVAQEHDLQYRIDLNGSQHTGLFLDQRDSRRRIFRAAGGKRVANLFSFTCSFSAAAVAGGAEVVFSVDLAASALSRGKENFELNGLTSGRRGKFIKEDVSKWLNRQERKKHNDPHSFQDWDIIICDPPVFASAGKGKGFHVEKQWPEMVRQIRFLLADNGIALFCNNHRSGSGRFYQTELEKHFHSVVRLQPPIDFPESPGEPDHVRIFWCEV